jgi:hypothetical protein
MNVTFSISVKEVQRGNSFRFLKPIAFLKYNISFKILHIAHLIFYVVHWTVFDVPLAYFQLDEILLTAK